MLGLAENGCVFPGKDNVFKNHGLYFLYFNVCFAHRETVYYAALGYKEHFV